jgi:uncharacterized membrane protein
MGRILHLARAAIPDCGAARVKDRGVRMSMWSFRFVKGNYDENRSLVLVCVILLVIAGLDFVQSGDCRARQMNPKKKAATYPRSLTPSACVN